MSKLFAALLINLIMVKFST